MIELIERYLFHVCLISAILALIILVKNYHRLTRGFIKGSYLMRGTRALLVIMIFFFLANISISDGYIIPLILDRKSTRLNSSHTDISRMPSSA